MLAAERAAEAQHQVGDLLGDAPHAGDVAGLLEVEDGADVQAADAGVAVEGAVGAVAAQRVAEEGHELRQPLRRHGGVLDERDRLGVAGHRVQQRHGGPAQVPQRVALGGVEHGDGVEQARDAVQPAAQSLDAVGHFRGRIAAELDHEQGLGPAADGPQGVAQGQVAGRQFQQQVVHQLDRRRPVLQADTQGVHGVGQRGELRDEQAARLRQRHQGQFGLGDDGQRALAADDQLVQPDVRLRIADCGLRIGRGRSVVCLLVAIRNRLSRL